MKTFVAALMVVSLAGSAVVPSMAAQAESCDIFMTRLRNAGRALTFPLPAVKIERNPYVTDSDAFLVTYAYADFDKEGSLDCSNGHVDDYLMDLDNYEARRSFRVGSPEYVRNVHIIAAAIYAYTGWPARRAIQSANMLLAKEPPRITPKSTYSNAELRTIYGAYSDAELNDGAVSISFGAVHVSGPCDPASYPTLCGPAATKK